jgi:hypothetical protein
MTLPHPITGSLKPGPELMQLYKDRFHPEGRFNVNSLKMLSLFNNTMTGQDQWMRTQINALKDTIVNFDTMDTTTEQRMDVKAAKRAISRGIANYGQMDGESHVIEPRQVIKEHAYTTGNVHSKLVAPWVSEMRAKHQAEEEQLREGEHRDTDLEDPHFELLRGKRNAFQARYQKVVKELTILHLAKLERSFNSRMDKESIPAGYRAVWDGLMKELEDMPNRTANVAYGIGENGMQMTDSDRTLFGQLTNWIGVFFEDECFSACLANLVPMLPSNQVTCSDLVHVRWLGCAPFPQSMVATGASCRSCSTTGARCRRLLGQPPRNPHSPSNLVSTRFAHRSFEQFGEQTLLLIFCGPKGAHRRPLATADRRPPTLAADTPSPAPHPQATARPCAPSAR